MQHIETVTVGSGGAASITFSAIPADYTDLVLVISARINSGTAPSLLLKPNGSTSNMTSRSLYGSGASAASLSASDTTTGVLNGSATTANTFGSFTTYIPNYRSAAAKSFSTDSVTENNGTTAYQWIQASLWNDTSAITSLELGVSTGSFVEHTTASLYGVLAGSDGIVSVS